MPHVRYTSNAYYTTGAVKKYLRYDGQRRIYKYVEADAKGYTILEAELTEDEATEWFEPRALVDAINLYEGRIWPPYVEVTGRGKK